MGKNYFAWSVTAGVLTVVLWNIYIQERLGFDGFIPGILSSFCVFAVYQLQKTRLFLRTNEV